MLTMGVSILNTVYRKDLTEQVTLGERLEGTKEVSHRDISIKTLGGEETEGLESGIGLGGGQNGQCRMRIRN